MIGENNFLTNWKKNTEYFDTLNLLSSLSGLFSDSAVPFLDYRLAENAFCKFFDARNTSRDCTAYDACLGKMGIGIKTFILKNDTSSEKIAEFNKLKKELDHLSGIDLAKKIGEFRNDRIDIADRLYGTSNKIYHIVGRVEGGLKLFNTAYERVNIDKITLNKDTITSISFNDDKNSYTFNKSKSVLIKKFFLNKYDSKFIEVKILKEPLDILREWRFSIDSKFLEDSTVGLKKGIDYVLLPLYSTTNPSIPHVPNASGLNQWNAKGRKRDPNEIYIPIPKKIHQCYPDFFPKRDMSFVLRLPNGHSLSAKVCQSDSKALMSNPNKELGIWLLRTVLKKKEGELVCMDDLHRLGCNSVRITKKVNTDSECGYEFSIDLAEINEMYSDFIE